MKLHGGTSSEHTKPSTRTVREKPAAEKPKPETPKPEKPEKVKKERAPRPPREGASRARIALIVVLAIIAAVVVAAAAGVGYVGKIRTIYPNVRVDGIDVGELSVEEAAERLTLHGYNVMGDDAITVALPLRRRHGRGEQLRPHGGRRRGARRGGILRP